MSAEKPTLLLIDGHSLAFRAFFALNAESFKAPDGQHTNAVHGFLSMLLSLLEREKPSHLLVAFDVSRESFRTREYPAYKATRGETPPEFFGQTEALERVLIAMNIRSLGIPDFEADDILATVAARGSSEGYRVLVVSGDRDTFQLIDQNTTVLYPIKGVLNLARMDDAAVVERYGVHAKQYPDVAALVGESSDNLVGVPGVGPKTAAKWVSDFGSLEAIIKEAERIPGKVGESLRTHSAAAIRNRRLNELRRDVPLPLELAELKLQAVDEQAVRKEFAQLGFKTLLNNVLKLRGNNGSQVLRENGTASPPRGSVTASGAKRDVSDEVPTAETVPTTRPPNQIPSLSQSIAPQDVTPELLSNHVCFIECDGDTIVGVGFANTKERFNWNGDQPALMRQVLLSSPLRAWNAKPFLRLVVQGNAALAPEDDALIAEYLLDPTRKGYTIENLYREHFAVDLPVSKPDLVTDSDPSLLAWGAHELLELAQIRLRDTGQLGIYREIELPLVPVLAQMEATGISVAVDDLRHQIQDLDKSVSALAQQAFEIVGREVNLASPKQLQVVLFDELGMPPTRAIKTGQTTNAEALADLFEQTGHPFLEKLLAHRDAIKIKQIAESLDKAVAADGRIHTRYSQVGTATGRLSSENPNLQNIPIRSERGAQLRTVFRAGEGFQSLLSADYSQIEMRLMAHLSQDEGLIAAYKTGEDLHRFVGSRIYGVKPAEVDATMRAKVKAMSYGLVYGLSEYGLARQLRIPRPEAKQLMSDYFSRFGGVKRYLDGVVEAAKADGFTQTVMGRRRPFPDLNSRIFQLRENARRAALNAPIQGTAADIMKLAMIRVASRIEKEGLRSRLLLQVHDELILEVASGERDQLESLVRDEMQGVVKLDVPLEVQVGFGDSWAAAAH